MASEVRITSAVLWRLVHLEDREVLDAHIMQNREWLLDLTEMVMCGTLGSLEGIPGAR